MALGQHTFGPVEEQAVNPTANDDSSAGFDVGTIWINTATDDVFLAADVSVGAAVWVGPLTSTAHAAVTLAADVEVLLGLTGQELTLDSQIANRVFAGPAAGGAVDPTFRLLVDADIPAAILRDAEHTAIGDGAPHHPAVTLGGGSDPALSLVGQELTLADVLTPAEHTAIGDGAPHHPAAHIVDSSGPHTGAGLTIGHVLRASGAAAFTFAELQHTDLGGVTADLHHTSFVQADADLLYEALGDIAIHAAIAGAHHAGVTLGGGSDPALALVGQELTLADVLTPTEHTAIGDGAPHHVKYTDADAVAAVEAANPLDLTNALLVDTINEHTGAVGVTIEGVLLKDSYIDLVELGADPAQVANHVLLYAKDDGGVSALYYRQDDGTVVGPLGAGGEGAGSVSKMQAHAMAV